MFFFFVILSSAFKQVLNVQYWRIQHEFHEISNNHSLTNLVSRPTTLEFSHHVTVYYTATAVHGYFMDTMLKCVEYITYTLCQMVFSDCVWASCCQFLWYPYVLQKHKKKVRYTDLEILCLKVIITVPLHNNKFSSFFVVIVFCFVFCFFF